MRGRAFIIAASLIASLVVGWAGMAPPAWADSDNDRIWDAAGACADEITHIPNTGLIIAAIRNRQEDVLKGYLAHLQGEDKEKILAQVDCATTVAMLFANPQPAGGDGRVGPHPCADNHEAPECDFSGSPSDPDSTAGIG